MITGIAHVTRMTFTITVAITITIIAITIIATKTIFFAGFF